MDKKKFDVKKSNLRARLLRAMFNNENGNVCDIAQEIFDAGYEMEELNLLPGHFTVLENIFIKTGWAPKINNQLD